MKIGINVKFGVAAGIINCAAWYFIAKSLGYYSLDIYSYKYYITLILLLVGVFASIYFERKSQNGFIDFKQALKTGILYALVLSTFLFLFNFIYHKYITPDAIDFFASEERKAWLEHSRTLEEVNKYLVEYYIPSFGSFHVFMTSLVWGILLSLAAGGIFRRKNPTPPFSEN